MHADEPEDSHSALRHGFAWSHLGWFMARENFAPRGDLVRSLARYPELRFLDRWDALVPLLLVLALWGAGALAAHHAPGLNTSGAQMVVWGFCISTVALYHATFSINSLAHYPAAARQGFFWWEIDLTWYGLRLLAGLGLIHGLKSVPADMRAATAGGAGAGT